MNLTLRSLTPDDEAWLDAWYPAAVARFDYNCADAAALLRCGAGDKQFQARVIASGATDVGLIAYRLRTPKDYGGQFELVLTPPEHARKGAGMAAAALAEQEMRAADMLETYAPAPAINGISMYFWIRLGYAPLMRDAWPCDSNGVAWLKRSLL